MSEIAVALVLCAAVLHATWNAIVKGTRARALVLAAVAATNATVGLGLLLWAETPAVASWPYIAASSIIHYGYYYFLALAYQWGDLSRVYPVPLTMAFQVACSTAAHSTSATAISDNLDPSFYLLALSRTASLSVRGVLSNTAFYSAGGKAC